MKLKIESMSYSVEMTTAEFLALTAIEDDDTLAFHTDLEKLGASAVDYNGHFGPYIFFTAEEEDIANKVYAKIKEFMEALCDKKQ